MKSPSLFRVSILIFTTLLIISGISVHAAPADTFRSSCGSAKRLEQRSRRSDIGGHQPLLQLWPLLHGDFRAEGLNAFAVMEIGSVDAAVLADYDVVLLARMTLTDAQAVMFTNWVASGGNLVAMRPDARLASLLGIAPVGGTLSNAYLLVDIASGPGVGTVNTTIQYHGNADLYSLNGATAVATLYSDATTVTANPAVTLRNVGLNGGQAAAFTYDLARSIVQTRSGNPACGPEWIGMVFALPSAPRTYFTGTPFLTPSRTGWISARLPSRRQTSSGATSGQADRKHGAR